MPARLAQHLVARGLLPAQTIDAAQRHQAAHGGSLDTALLELGGVAEAGMLQALADVSELRPVNLADFEPNPEMARFIPANVAQRLGSVPLSEAAGTLHVACTYPPPTRDLQDVSVLLGRKLELWIALEARVQEWIAAVYNTPIPPRFGVLLASLDPANQTPDHTAVTQPEGIPLAPGTASAGEDITLEDALTRDMVEQIARAVAEEPILLEVRKKPKVPPAWAREETVTLAPEHVRQLRESVAAKGREPTVHIDADRARALRAAASLPSPVAPRPSPQTPPRPQPVPQRASQPAPQKPPPLPPPLPSQRLDDRTATPALGTPIPVLDEPVPPPAVVPPAPVATAPVVAPVPIAPAPVAPAPVAPAQAATPAPAAKAEPVGPPWTLEQARTALQSASQDRDELIAVTLRFARQTFEFAAAFAVVRGQAVLRDLSGENAAALLQSRPAIPLDASSVFRTVAMTRGSYVGPPPGDTLTTSYLQQLSRAPRTLFLFPVEVKNRVVCIVYGDPGANAVSQRRLSELLLFCRELPRAFGDLLMFRKQRFGNAKLASVLSLDDLEPSADASAGLGWSPSVRSTPGSTRTISYPEFQLEDPLRPPSDFGPLLQKLTGPDAAARANAMAELARTPEASARELAKHFPGPTAWSRFPVTELPEPEELGPIPAALSRLGRAGAEALAPLLDSDDGNRRYYALLAAGSLRYPELVGGVLRGLFDYEPDIAAAARAAASTLRRLPRFDTAMRDLRQELAALDPLRRSLAARALGVLHDRESIEALINLTGSEDALCAQTAAEALNEITRAGLKPDQRRWSAWWAENRGRLRAEWLISALRHADLDVRLSAIEELSRAMNDNLGYFADAPHAARDAAVAKWQNALAQNPKLKRLD